jgi:hypothetical protein
MNKTVHVGYFLFEIYETQSRWKIDQIDGKAPTSHPIHD